MHGPARFHPPADRQPGRGDQAEQGPLQLRGEIECLPTKLTRVPGSAAVHVWCEPLGRCDQVQAVRAQHCRVSFLLLCLQQLTRLACGCGCRQSRKNIHAHYDISNEFFSLFLDQSMTYSCGVFKQPTDSLYQAQLNKLEALVRSEHRPAVWLTPCCTRADEQGADSRERSRVGGRMWLGGAVAVRRQEVRLPRHWHHCC